MAAQPSLIRIVNRAAVHLGTSRRITAMDEDTPLANAARDTIDFIRDELLAAHPWNFALGRWTIAAVTLLDHQRGRYTRAFEKPADMLRWLPSRPDEDYWADDIEQEGDWLLSDAAAPLEVRGIARVEDPTKWSSGFNAAMAAQLALEIAPVITNSDALDRKLVDRMERAIARAKRQDGLASGRRGRTTAALSNWLAARGGYGFPGGRERQYGAPIV